MIIIPAMVPITAAIWVLERSWPAQAATGNLACCARLSAFHRLCFGCSRSFMLALAADSSPKSGMEASGLCTRTYIHPIIETNVPSYRELGHWARSRAISAARGRWYSSRSEMNFNPSPLPACAWRNTAWAFIPPSCTRKCMLVSVLAGNRFGVSMKSPLGLRARIREMSSRPLHCQ